MTSPFPGSRDKPGDDGVGADVGQWVSLKVMILVMRTKTESWDGARAVTGGSGKKWGLRAVMGLQGWGVG